MKLLSVVFFLVGLYAGVEWDPIQELTYPPSNIMAMAYNHSRSIGSYGDSVYIVFSRADQNYELSLLRSFDGGATWDEPIGTGIARVIYPAMAIGPAGEIHAIAFLDYNPYVIYGRSLDAGQTWEAETLAMHGGPSEYNPEIDVDSSGNVHVLYRLNTSVAIWYLKSSDAGTSWQGPDSIFPDNDTLHAPWHPSLTVDGTNRLHVLVHVWRELPIVPQIRYSMSPDNGASWTPLTPIHVDLAPFYSLDASGDTLAFAWHSNDTYFQVYLMASTNAGSNWISPIQISDNAGGGDILPVLSFDPYGGMHIVWEDGGYFGVCYRYVSPDFVPNDTTYRLSDLPTYYAHPHIHCDAKGRVHVAWVQHPDDGTPFQVYYRRGTIVTGVDESPSAPVTQKIYVYPSVFSQAVNIVCRGDGNAWVSVYDAGGRCVRTFMNGDALNSLHTNVFQWNGKDNCGFPLPAGVYFVRARIDAVSYTEKILYVK